jgi:hypothetical protein
LVYEEGIPGFLFVAAVRCRQGCDEEVPFFQTAVETGSNTTNSALSLSQERNFAVCRADQ